MGIFPTIAELMDSRENLSCSDELHKSTSGISTTAKEKRKSIPELLPGVHNVNANTSQVSSHRAMLQTWEIQRRKLYQYSSSEIEVFVERKNGVVEKLQSYKKDKHSHNYEDADKPVQSPTKSLIDDVKVVPEGGDDAIKPNSGSENLDETHFLTNTCKDGNFTDSFSLSSRGEADTGSLIHTNDTLLEELNVVPLGENLSRQLLSLPFPKENKTSVVSPPYVKNLYSSSSNVITELKFINHESGLSVNPVKKSCHHVINKYEPNCKFIFKRLSTVPYSEKRGYLNARTTSTQTLSNLSAVKTEDKASQVCESNCDDNCVHENKLFRTPHGCDFASQTFVVEYGTLSTQTQVDETQVGIQTDEPEQIKKEIDEISTQTDQIERSVVSFGIQTEEIEQLKVEQDTVSTQTEYYQVEFGIQTEDLDVPKVVTSKSAQTNDSQNYETFRKQMVLMNTATKECQANEVPCCDAYSQTVSKWNPVQENFSQTAWEVTSKHSQTQLDIRPTEHKVIQVTPTPVNTQDFGVQLSGSCCYFTRKQERKLYRRRLKTLFPQVRIS